MSIRQKFFDSVNRISGNYIPFDIELCPILIDEFKKRTGAENYLDYFKAPIRSTGIGYNGDTGRYNKYLSDLTDLIITPWGIGLKKGTLAHFNRKIHPMKNFDTLQEFKDFPYPKFEEFETGNLKNVYDEIKKRDLVANASLTQTVFEKSWQMRSMEELLMDMLSDKELASYLFDRLTEVQVKLAKKCVMAGCDILSLGDDVATQLDMLMSVDMWREFLKPRISYIIAEAKNVNPDVKIFYHSCGNIQAIIPELIEIGVDILNPIQPECMDPVDIKQKYGDRLTMWGGLGTQTTMPFGTADEVYEKCKYLIENLNYNGGYIMSPSHVVEPEVPWENVMALIKAVSEYNN